MYNLPVFPGQEPRGRSAGYVCCKVSRRVVFQLMVKAVFSAEGLTGGELLLSSLLWLVAGVSASQADDWRPSQFFATVPNMAAGCRGRSARREDGSQGLADIQPWKSHYFCHILFTGSGNYI